MQIYIIIIATITGSCWGQCNGPPLIQMPNNSTGNLAFPEANLDPMTGDWLGNHFYPPRVNCTWILRAPPEHVINMRFINFETEEKFDFVTIYSSEDKTNGAGLFQFSGVLNEDWEAVTPDNTMVLDFVSDEYNTQTGFQLAYRYMPKACVPGGVVLKESQLVALPPWNLQGALPGPSRPDFKPMILEDQVPGLDQTFAAISPRWMNVSSYPQGLNCTWQFAVDVTDIIEIEFMQFHTNPSDFLQIWKVDGDRVVPFRKFWEGKKPNKKIISSSALVMNFLSVYGDEDTGRGFLLNISYSTRACSKKLQYLNSPRGYLAYPNGNFKGKQWEKENPIQYGPDNCTWTIKAPTGYVINITVQELDTRSEDLLEVTENRKLLVMYGGTFPKDRSLISNTNEVVVVFNSASESQNSGFLLHYSWVLKDCKYELSPEGGEIRSPYYPDIYGSELHCQWNLVPGKHVVHVVMLRLKMDDGDFLQMSDGKEKILISSDSQPLSEVKFSSGSPIVINFLSDSSSNRGYFYFKYTVFESGNCDFALTTCGWKSLDPLHAWSLDEKNGIVFTQESESRLLPRGYKSQLESPILEPAAFNSDKPTKMIDMCLEFEYLIKGTDAFQLNVAFESKNGDKTEAGNEHSMKLYTVNGPHGNKFLWTALNFTVTGYFRIIFSYERGYGPDYLVAIDSIRVKSGLCLGARVNDLASFTCHFNESFCGWKNTHSDNHNWELEFDGIRAMGNATLASSTSYQLTNGKYVSQFADLISPVIISADIFNLSGTSFEDSCMHLSYQIYSSLASLKVLIDSTNENSAGNIRDNLWIGGKFASSRILHAEIPLNRQLIPESFRITIRALASQTPKFVPNKGGVSHQNGVLLKSVTLESGKCSTAEECTLSNGFCTWATDSSGRAAWHIKEGENNTSFAAVSRSNGGEFAALLSHRLTVNKRSSLNFRYKINSLESQCLQIGIRKDAISDVSEFNVSSSDVSVLWMQCKDKGSSWLHECVELPIMSNYSQILISAKFVEDFVSTPIVLLDNLRITPNGCSDGEEKSKWSCLPEDSLCGLTQSAGGSWKWVLVGNKENITKEDISSVFSCINGDIIPISLMCNGYPDCTSAEDEINCDHMDYTMSDTAFTNGIPNMTSPVTCTDGRELNSLWLCDGIQDCEDGSDELNCGCKGADCGLHGTNQVRTDTCDGNQFRCLSGAICSASNCMHDFCIDRSFVCDGIFHCNSREDENGCSVQPAHQVVATGGNDDRMECSGGLYIPKLFRCDGRKDCPLDGKDEVGCHHCGDAEFLCPTTGVCLPWPAVCDGDLSIDTCTDEDFCQTCPFGYFACDVCLSSQQVCDGVWDCKEGEDETRCMETSLTSMPMGDSPMLGHQAMHHKPHCRKEQFQCSSGSCIELDALCNRIQDCEEGDDEFKCPDHNFENLRYISAKSEQWHHTLDDSSSSLITPVLKVENGSVGILSFRYRLDCWMGPSNISLSIEILKISGNESLLPSNLWRQSGHKGKLWIKEEVILPDIQGIEFRVAFVVAGAGIQHHSEKIHISDLSFSPIYQQDLRELMIKRTDCHFDYSWCGWNQAITQNGYTWIQTLTSPHSRRTGPLAGYSGGENSGFLLADSVYGKAGDTAELVSPAMLLPKEEQHICWRVMVFLYGTNVAGVGFHAQQRFTGHIFSKELLKLSSAQGLTWFPVSIDVTKDHLSDPNEPFFLVITAIRGQGSESDVAIDEIKISFGRCTDLSQSFALLEHFPEHADMYILKAGIPSKPYVNQPEGFNGKSKDGVNEYCSYFEQCSTCVSSEITRCSWCAEGHFCIWESSPRATICSKSRLITHTTIGDSSITGSSSCPRIINDKNHQIYIPDNSSPMLQFTVENIQKYPTANWLCRYSFPNGQAKLTENPSFEDEMALLGELKNPDGNEEFWNVLKGFAVSEKNSQPRYEVTEVTGKFQALTSLAENTSYQSGIVTCGNGHTSVNLPQGESFASVNISIITPQGNPLDNPDNVQVAIYNCKGLALDCESCVSLNSSFDCGWCSQIHRCLLSTDCPHGRWNSHQDASVCRIRDDLDILTELLSVQETDFDGEFEDSLMDTEDAEFFAPSNIKKKGGKNLRKNLQSRRERHSKVDGVKIKKRSKDSKGKADKKRKSEENRKKEKGSRKGKRRSFLKVPFDASVYIARNMWRLHTGKQYYIPVKKKTMLNLSFVRQVNYGDLNKEKSRTVLIDGKWKKAVGYFVDLFENAEDDPVTSIITTKKDIFDQLLGQL